MPPDLPSSDAAAFARYGASGFPRYDANLSMLFTELPLLRRPAAAAEAGFGAVEMWWPFDRAVPGEAEVDALARAVEDAGVRLVTLNFFGGDLAAGERGVASAPDRVPEFRENLEVAVTFGHRLGCRMFNALYGNRIERVASEEQDELATENLVAAARAVARIDGLVLVEPLSGIPSYPLRTAADVIAVLDRVERSGGVTNMRMLLDLYHLAANGDNLAAAIDSHADRVGHVQIADHPGRHEPGTGELDLRGAMTLLESTGYDGFVGLEYLPLTDTLSGLGWLPADRRRS